MSNEIVKQDQIEAPIMESVLLGGDLSKLTPAQRVSYYKSVCTSLGLNPLTKPFDYIQLNGKLTLYARKDCADQLRELRGVSVDDVNIRDTEKQFIVTVKGHDKNGRADVEIGVVNKTDMRGDAANAMMKAVTKAKRRLTLSICGLGWSDETEIETIPTAKPVIVNDNGEIVNGAVVSPENISQETGEAVAPVELIDPMSDWAVSYAADKWNVGKGEAAKNIAGMKLGKRVNKSDFESIVSGEGQANVA